MSEKSENPPPSSDVVDTSVMLTLFGKENPIRFKKILGVYVRAGEKDVADIRVAYEEKSLETIAELMHKIKSSSLSLGVVKMADFCVVCERAAKNGEWDILDQRMENLEEIWAEVLAFYEDY